MASYIPPNPARLDGIGGSTREAVIDLESTNWKNYARSIRGMIRSAK